MPDKLRLLIIGDIVGKCGRRTVAALFPALTKEFSPDCVIANIENLAHGKGVTVSSLQEMADAGVTIFTGGNHVWHKLNPADDEIRNTYRIALPANDPRTIDSMRAQTVSVAGTDITIINLLGQVGMISETTENPFTTFDALYEKAGAPTHCIVDFHAEATSEKVAFGFYVNGRASIVFGTHTHIPTADERILSEGTGFITDAGMTGSNDSVLGVAKETIIKRFLGLGKDTFAYPETGAAWMNALYCELDKNSGKCIRLERIQRTLTIK